MHRALLNSNKLSSIIVLYCGIFPTVANGTPVVAVRQLTPTTISRDPLSTTVPVSPDSNSVTFTDGGGIGFSVPSILWIVFAVILALPLSVAGLRLWRITSGIGVALSLSLLVWAIFVNSTPGGSLADDPITSDLFLSLFVWGFFIAGFIFGFIKYGVMIGISLLGADAGVALGILLTLLRPGLLIPIYAINFIPMSLLGLAGALWPLWRQRLAVLVSTSAIGMFFAALSIDLVVNKQSGMSQGLRFLLDRNKVHLSETLRIGYRPPLSTIIIIGACILLIPAFSFLQHRVWKEPFDRSPESLEAYKISVKGTPILGPGDEGYIPPAEKNADPKIGPLQPNLPPQHTHLHFPSLVPGLPGNVSKEYSTAQQTSRSNPPPMQATPGVGVGRRPFVGHWGDAINAAKRVSNRMSAIFAGSGKRASQMSAPSIYSVATMDNQNRPGLNAPNGGSDRLQPPNAIFRPNQDQGSPASDHSGLSSVYSGAALSPTKPLQLPSRLGNSVSSATRNATAASSYAQRGPSNGYPQRLGLQPQQRAPPPASLRSGRGWNNVTAMARGGGGLSPIQSQPNTPLAPMTPRTPITLHGQMHVSSTAARGPAPGIPSVPRRDRNPPAPAPRIPADPSANQNRLKASTRYNLL